MFASQYNDHYMRFVRALASHILMSSCTFDNIRAKALTDKIYSFGTELGKLFFKCSNMFQNYNFSRSIFFNIYYFQFVCRLIKCIKGDLRKSIGYFLDHIKYTTPWLFLGVKNFDFERCGEFHRI